MLAVMPTFATSPNTCKATAINKDVLGRRVKKDLRERTYNKIVKLGVRSTDGMSMAGLTQVSMEGGFILPCWASSALNIFNSFKPCTLSRNLSPIDVYLPQFFFAMLAPIILFAICVWIDWRTALVLLACVPLIRGTPSRTPEAVKRTRLLQDTRTAHIWD